MKKKIKRIVIIVLIILAGIGIFSGVSYYRNSKAKDTTPLETVLEKSSDLTTQKLVITDVFECSKGKIPILTKNNFLVRYQTTVTAGFDVNKAEIKETDNKITVTIPHCTIDEDSIKIKSDDLKIYDTGFAILNVNQDDLLEVVSEAESRAKEQAKYDLRSFSKELNDVSMVINLNIETGDFLSFADWFFDNFFVDWMVQDKINKARDQVRDAILKVENVMRELERY